MSTDDAWTLYNEALEAMKKVVPDARPTLNHMMELQRLPPELLRRQLPRVCKTRSTP